MIYAAYDPEGRILQLLTGNLDEVTHAFLGTDTQVIEVGSYIDSNRYYVESNALLEKGSQPTVHHRFDYPTKTWVDPRTLADIKTQHWEKIKEARDAAEFSNFTWDTATFDGDEKAQGRIKFAAQGAMLAAMAAQPFLVDWTLADNTTRALTGDDVIAAAQALGAAITAAHETARGLRAQIDAATTKEEVEAVVWPV